MNAVLLVGGGNQAADIDGGLALSRIEVQKIHSDVPQHDKVTGHLSGACSR